jgi:hypothetical protein
LACAGRGGNLEADLSRIPASGSQDPADEALHHGWWAAREQTLGRSVDTICIVGICGQPHGKEDAVARRNAMASVFEDRLTLLSARAFDKRLDAEMARDLLEGHGLRSCVSGEGARGIDAAAQMMRGVGVERARTELAPAHQRPDNQFGGETMRQGHERRDLHR